MFNEKLIKFCAICLCNLFIRKRVYLIYCLNCYVLSPSSFWRLSFLLYLLGSLFIKFCPMGLILRNANCSVATIPTKQLTFLTGAKVFQERGKRSDTPHHENTRLELLCDNANCRLKGETISQIFIQGNMILWHLERSPCC